MGTGAHSCLCDTALKEGQLLGDSGLLPKVVQPSEKWDSPPFLPSPLEGEEPLLLPDIMLLPLLHTHAWEKGEMCPQGCALLGERFPLLPQFFSQETNPNWNSFSSISSLQHEEHTRANRAGLPPCLLSASSCGLSHAPRSIGPLQAALAGMTMAPLPHGNIYPEYSALIFLPSPNNAKAWGRKIIPWGRSIPTSLAR